MNSERISKILDFKQFKRDIHEAELKKYLEALNSEKRKLASIEDDIQKIITEYLQSQDDGSINIKELNFFYDYLNYMNKLAEDRRNIITKKTQELEEKKEQLINANIEKQMIEILHDKVLKEELKETEKRLQSEIDLNFLYNQNRDEK
ncbi:MAG: flagellar FliJ family protein [Thermodesulfovibrionales bacterium]|nr:flagellar FliJ family protein [Thermodesulfovibrionales bacterium]